MAPKGSKADKKMAASERTIEELTLEVARLRSDLRVAEAETTSWRKKADKQRSRVQKVRAKAEVAIAEAADVARKRAKAKMKKKVRQAIADHPRAEPLALRSAPALPQPTWTVAQLRVAAREQGVPDYTRMRKDQLLDALI